ncbi:alkyl hydroperoxide reductase subunit F [Spirochaeta dissipatitropha]
MLDASIVNQLKSIYAPLEHSIELNQLESKHPKQMELSQLLDDLADCSSSIHRSSADHESEIPAFSIGVNGKHSGIYFRCVPGGHEFSSLVLAVLNAGGLGKWPDEALKSRVRALQGPIEVTTYISLSCTNCPDIVQSLNQMALMHENFQHTIVDGSLVPDEINDLKIQGVPAVFIGGKLLHSGRADFSTLLDKLEIEYGSSEPVITTDHKTEFYDVLILGGGPAGVSAAIYSARKGLKTAVIARKIGGQVNETQAIENFISIPRTVGKDLSASLREHMDEYSIDIRENRDAVYVEDHDGIKTVHVKGGESFAAPSLIIASGAQWKKLNIPGESDYIGRGVAFCPHCDGPFYVGKDVAVIGGGNSGIEAAIDLAGICKKVTVFEYAEKLNADSVLQEAAGRLNNIEIICNARTTELSGDGNKLTSIHWQDRISHEQRSLTLDGVFVQIGLNPNSSIVSDLVDLNKNGEIIIDAYCRSSAPGIYAAGDVSSTAYKQIIIAAGEGAKAALASFDDRIRLGDNEISAAAAGNESEAVY